MALGPHRPQPRSTAIPILTAGVCAPVTRAGESEGLRAVAFNMQNILTVHMDSLKKKERTKKEGRRVIFQVTRARGFVCVCPGLSTGSHGDPGGAVRL